MSRNTRLRWAALVAGVALVLAGCSSTGGKQAEESANNAVGAGKADTPKITIAMVTHGAPGDTFWDIIRKGAQAAAAKDRGEPIGVASMPRSATARIRGVMEVNSGSGQSAAHSRVRLHPPT